MLTTQKGKLRNEYIDSYILFDLETTGISSNYDEVIEISAIKVKDKTIVDTFSELVNPGKPIPYGATAVNGITDAMVENIPAFDQILPDFIEFISNEALVGHNIHSFDMKFIYRDCLKYFGMVPDNDYVDTLKFARLCLPQLSHYKLTDLASYYCISTEGAHRALNDCSMNQKVYEYLAEEYENIEKNSQQLKKCPHCGDFMKRRNGKFGAFWGCGGYPACRYTEKIR